MLHLSRVEINVSDILKKRKLGTDVQKYIDSECMRLMDPYTPFDKGTLKSSPQRQTTLGSGKIVQQTPYAKKWYYTPADFQDAPRRGNKWFERMKENHKRDILNGAAKIAGGKIE